ncbi:peptidoglycan DD-metalloendopeptidase family protein [Pseudomonas silvicola]|uniref:peptidoglycan DD-metalloendopeptidase family protein n=1 Tax=Pseudomonas sp. RIT-To-2 TaxID=3462541 RepID=UPI00227B1F06|nr:peptidoglycan DD-metalloendopeptidase family protein [Pseudomonas silvicola]
MSPTVNRQHAGLSSYKLLVIGLALATTLAGCSSSPSGGVRVVDRSNGGSASAPAAPERQPVTTGQYRVKRGDTLFSIAFRYGWDYKALAARNSIPEPYTIHPGQTIRFGDGRAPTVVASTTKTETSTSPGGSFTVTRRPIIFTPVPGDKNQKAPAQSAPATVPEPVPVPAGEKIAGGWTWPANGVLIGKFASNGSLNKGVDIAGELGQPVFAASDGSVVYAGSGLRGYGELIIIKHSDTYVSAYGHNRRLLVREGQQVKAGQTIAEMGSTGTDRVKLHFEIRRQGKPVDPLQFLPRR